MHKKFYFYIVLTLLLTFILNQPTFAASCNGVDTSIIECEGDNVGAIRYLLINLVNILAAGIGIIGVIGISIAGIQYLTAGGNEEQTRKAKRRINEIIIGLVAYALIWVIAQWLLPGGILLNKIDVEKISISQSSVNLNIGDSVELKINTYPLDSYDQNLKYESSNPSVVTVDQNGRITARSAGKATITATTSNDQTASSAITVNDSSSSPSVNNPQNNNNSTNDGRSN